MVNTMPEARAMKLGQIKLLAMDFDGVHTDGFVYVGEDGYETVRCSRRDSLGLAQLARAGIKLVVISKEENPVVRARCAKLGIECYQGVHDGAGKKEILMSLIAREGMTTDEVVFIGDDVNDCEVVAYAGIGVTVADGHEAVKKCADIILTRKGGDHALRELADMILKARGIDASF